jgi:hypothetical protein
MGTAVLPARWLMADAGGEMMCDGTIVVHEDWSYTCTEVDCGASESRIVAMGRHSWFLACRDVLGDSCPVCRPVRRDDAVSTARN